MGGRADAKCNYRRDCRGGVQSVGRRGRRGHGQRLAAAPAPEKESSRTRDAQPYAIVCPRRGGGGGAKRCSSNGFRGRAAEALQSPKTNQAQLAPGLPTPRARAALLPRPKHSPWALRIRKNL